MKIVIIMILSVVLLFLLLLLSLLLVLLYIYMYRPMYSFLVHTYIYIYVYIYIRVNIHRDPCDIVRCRMSWPFPHVRAASALAGRLNVGQSKDCAFQFLAPACRPPQSWDAFSHVCSSRFEVLRFEFSVLDVYAFYLGLQMFGVLNQV